MNGKISNFAQVASVRRYTITEGQERGLDVLDCNNGKIRFLLNVCKACDIMQLYHEGKNVSFISKNGFTNRETDFMNRFEGGMLYTCGLDSLGCRTGYEMHGTFHNLPAQIVSAKCDEQGIEVQAIIRDTALFGKNLVMKRRIFSAIGSDYITLEDTLVNEGCLICEIQQNSNLTYRVYDYGRKDKNGNERELHIDKALRVTNLNKFIPITFEDCLGKSEYFTVKKREIDGELQLSADEKSFHCVTCVKGDGFIEDMEINEGDSFFVPAHYGEYVVKGNI